MRKPSEPVQIRTLRRELAEERRHTDTALKAQHHWQQRATKAEQDAMEWKARFDALLARVPALKVER